MQKFIEAIVALVILLAPSSCWADEWDELGAKLLSPSSENQVQPRVSVSSSAIADSQRIAELEGVVARMVIALESRASEQHQAPVQQVPEIVVAAGHAPWRGGHIDPLAAMVDWNSVAPNQTCVLDASPWSGRNAALIENKSSQPGYLQIDGRDVLVTTIDARVRTAIIENREGRVRRSVLMPGERCYVMLAIKSKEVAYYDGWKVKMYQTTHNGLMGHFMLAGPGSELYTVPLFENDSGTSTIKDRGQRYRASLGVLHGLR
jgi:hypothetical protein